MSLALMLTLTGAAQAASPWVPGVMPGDDVNYAELFFTGSGEPGGLFSSRAPSRPASVTLRGLGTDGAPEGAESGPYDPFLQRAIPFGDDGLIVSSATGSGVLIGSLKSGLSVTGPPVAPDLQQAPTDIDANRRGDIAILAPTSTGAGFELWLRPAELASFRMVRRFSVRGPRLAGVKLAIGPAGDMLLTYSRRSRFRVLFARRLSADGHMGTEILVGRARGGGGTGLVESDGRAVVAWTDRDRGLRVTSAAPGHGFGPAHRVGAAGSRTPVGFSLVSASPRRELLAWTVTAGRNKVVNAVDVAAGKPRRTQQLTSSGRYAIQGVAAAHGAAVILWTPEATDRDAPLYASVRSNPSTRFVTELIDSAAEFGPTTVAMNPATTSVMASYRQASGRVLIAVRGVAAR